MIKIDPSKSYKVGEWNEIPKEGWPSAFVRGRWKLEKGGQLATIEEVWNTKDPTCPAGVF